MRHLLAAVSIASLGVFLAGCAGSEPPDTNLASLLPPARDMAVAAESRGDWAGAAQNWQKTLEAAPDDRVVRLSLARALRLSERCGPAATVLAPLLTAAETDSAALVENAKCALVSGRPEAAESQLRTAIAAAPDLWETWSTLAVTLDRQGRHDEALPHHDRAMELAPNKPIVISNRALSLALAGRLDESLVMMRQAAAIPGAPARVRINLAMLEAMAGRTERAATILSQEILADKTEAVTLVKRIADSAGESPR